MNVWLRIVQLAYRLQIVRLSVFAALLLILILAACGRPAAPAAVPFTAPEAASAATTAPAPAPAAAPPTVTQSLTSPITFVRKIDTSAQHLANPGSLAVDQQGNVYLADSASNPRILEYDPHGTFLLEWGSNGSGDGQFAFAPANPNDGPTTGFLALDAQGNPLVSDGYNDRIQKFDPSGKFLAKWGRKGQQDGQFDGPLGPLYIDRAGSIYVSQFDRLQQFDPHDTFLATYGSGGAGDGQFSSAAVGASDSQGNLYVANTDGNSVYVFRLRQ